MKKMILIAMLAIAGVASADLVDGDFQDNLMNPVIQSSMNYVDHNNAGWVGSSMDLYTNGANYGIEMDGQFFGAADHYYVGQIWTESSVLSSTASLTFDILSQNYTDSVTNPVVTVEFFSFDGSAGTWRKVGLQNNNLFNGGWTQIGSTLNVDISGGVGSYQTANIDLSGNTDLIYGIRIGLSSTSDGTFEDTFVMDNVSIVPEPATVGMLGLGALISLLIRRIRK